VRNLISRLLRLDARLAATRRLCPAHTAVRDALVTSLFEPPLSLSATVAQKRADIDTAGYFVQSVIDIGMAKS